MDGNHRGEIFFDNHRFVVMILQLAVIFFYLAVGELIVWLTGVPVPSSIIGMVLLAASLCSGVLDIRRVDRVADFLVRNLGFFFVPAGVGLINCFGLVSDEWVPIVVAAVVSTFLVIAATGWSHQMVRRFLSRRSSRSSCSENGISH